MRSSFLFDFAQAQWGVDRYRGVEGRSTQSDFKASRDASTAPGMRYYVKIQYILIPEGLSADELRKDNASR